MCLLLDRNLQLISSLLAKKAPALTLIPHWSHGFTSLSHYSALCTCPSIFSEKDFSHPFSSNLLKFHRTVFKYGELPPANSMIIGNSFLMPTRQHAQKVIASGRFRFQQTSTGAHKRSGLWRISKSINLMIACLFLSSEPSVFLKAQRQKSTSNMVSVRRSTSGVQACG